MEHKLTYPTTHPQIHKIKATAKDWLSNTLLKSYSDQGTVFEVFFYAEFDKNLFEQLFETT